MAPDSLRSPLFWLAAVVLLASLGKMARTIEEAPAIDFYHYWLVGQIVRSGEARDIYAPEARVALGELYWQRAQRPEVPSAQRAAAEKFRRLETTSTPFLYAAFAPFVTGDYDWDRVAYNALSSLLLLISVAGLCRGLRYGALASVLILVFATVGFEPTYFDVRVGNVNRIEFALLTAFLLLPADGERHEVVRGVVLGLAVMFKPNLALPAGAIALLRFAGGEWWRLAYELLGMALGAGAALLAASRFFGGFDIWLDWLRAASNLARDFPLSSGEGNLALAPLLGTWLGAFAERAFSIAAAGAAALLLVAAAWRAAGSAAVADSRARLRAELLAVGVGCAVSLLVSPLAWVHYYVLALFLVLFVLSPSADDVPGWRLAVTIACVAATAMGPLLNPLLISEARIWAIVGNLGLIGLIALALIELSGRTRAAGRSS